MNRPESIRKRTDIARRATRAILTAVFACVLLVALPGLSSGSEAGAGPETEDARGGKYSGGWKLKLKDSAVVAGETVFLGEIADPIGPLDAEL
jgi:hypothetical protein